MPVSGQNIATKSPEIMPADESRQLARFFQVLADPTRLRIVRALADDCLCVSDLSRALKMDQPAISHQLKYLRRMQLVAWEKRGRHVYYRLDNHLLKDVLYMVVDRL